MVKQKSGNADPEGNKVPARDAHARACAVGKAGVDCDAGKDRMSTPRWSAQRSPAESGAVM
ncbi:MAG: hypothetical protein Q7K57_30610, partial [Burkholderiaceae bacterium]|nr:hypothetical protein [Burkholderiaceae bacterium]